MEDNLKQLSYTLIGVLTFTAILFTLWAGYLPHEQFKIVDLLPWFFWIPSPYLVLAIMVHVFRKSSMGLRVSLTGIITVGCISSWLMIDAYHRNDHSGMLWLFVPIYELLGCLLALIVVLILRRIEKRKAQID